MLRPRLLGHLLLALALAIGLVTHAARATGIDGKMSMASSAMQTCDQGDCSSGGSEPCKSAGACERSRNLNEHSQGIVLGNDATGEWTRNSPLGDLDRLVMDIRAMDPKWREQVRSPAHGTKGDRAYQLSREPGQVLFKKLCSACHTIGVGDHVGPDLLGVTARRERDWLINFIVDPLKMRRQKDPLALALAAKYPGAIMPRLGLSKNDAGDLIAYVEAQTARLSNPKRTSEPDPHSHHHHKH